MALPVDPNVVQPGPTALIQATYTDPETGAVYIHRDLRDSEPAREINLAFGDVESFVSYVRRFGNSQTLLVWNEAGMEAIFDHGDAVKIGRQAWRARQPFTRSDQWGEWTKNLVSGRAVSQRAAVEFLEDNGEDIVSPAGTDMATILRSLRVSVNAKAETDLHPDGTSSVSFSRETAVKAGPNSVEVELPSHISIAIPVLKGHTDAAGKPVVYRFDVLLRASVDEGGHLALRFSIPGVELVLEAVFAERVAAAKVLLGSDYELLRGAD